jgi:aspartyl protease family protein
MMGRIFWLLMALIGAGLIVLTVNNTRGMTLGVPNDDFAESIYLGIWGIVVAAGLLHRRLRVAVVARDLAVWIFVGLVLAAGYTYRYDLNGIATRVVASLVPGAPISGIDQKGGLTVTVVKAANGHFEANGLVNGAPVHFLVDTGATPVVLTASAAERAGIRPSDLSYSIPVMTANGEARAATVVLDTVTIGKITRHNISAVVAPDSKLPGSLLGMDFLNTLSGFSVGGDKLVMKD